MSTHRVIWRTELKTTAINTHKLDNRAGQCPSKRLMKIISKKCKTRQVFLARLVDIYLGYQQLNNLTGESQTLLYVNTCKAFQELLHA
jgi:hypothetical protein